MHALVSRCQETYQAWRQAVDSHQRNELSRIYRSQLEELFQILEPELTPLVQRWFHERFGYANQADRDSMLLVNEIIDVFVKNIFAYLAHTLPGLPGDEQTAMKTRLLELAEASLSK
jgi:hypothetical protein